MRLASRITAAVVVAVALCAAGAGARAEEPAAKAAFLEGERSFQLGKFEDAIAAYERAFSLDPQPAFVFNIALAHRRQYEIDGKLDHLLRARELYRDYLRLDPQSRRRAGIEKLLVELGAKIEAARATGAGATTPAAVSALTAPSAPAPTSPAPLIETRAPTAPAPSGTKPSHTGLYIAGVAGIVAAVGLTILLASAHARDPSYDGPPVDLTPR